jgi:protein-tyrosine phosphatase
MKTVLFLCSGNYYRSRFAEAVFNACAVKTGLDWRAISRGFRLNSSNHGPISPHALRALEQRRLAPAEPIRSPLTATEEDLKAADLTIALKESEHRPMATARFPGWADRIEYWQIDDVDCATPEAALPHLGRQVQTLVRRLAGN